MISKFNYLIQMAKPFGEPLVELRAMLHCEMTRPDKLVPSGKHTGRQLKLKYTHIRRKGKGDCV
ncbi:hypothetical protein HMI46_26580 [Paenibacillus alvei]|uniref:Uncharacterized protein n=1 Tax=Paenibacillus alvei TaxID=44250 RepID=A0AAP7DLG9_PAEAL|nr:hypothetical protein [Paenibacillus alvei]